MKRLVTLLLLMLPAVATAQGTGYKPLHPDRRKALYEASDDRHGARLAMLGKFQSLPSSFDCRDKGWVLPIGDQGQCGSCYLYSTIYGTLSQTFVKAGYGKPDGSLVMSVQFGMDRPRDFGGCDGGNGTEVIEWVRNNGWVAESWTDVGGKPHKDYPAYQARSGNDRTAPGAKKDWKIEWGFASASPNRPATTLEIQTALYNFGPLNVALDAGGQFGNGTGTITSLGSSIDHEIELVAWDDAKDGGAFLLKNQWSTQWGNAGYRWVTYKAAARLVDVFYVSATPLPPPIPPTPPVPPTSDKITASASSGQAGDKVTVTWKGAATVSDATVGLYQSGKAPVWSSSTKGLESGSMVCTVPAAPNGQYAFLLLDGVLPTPAAAFMIGTPAPVGGKTITLSGWGTTDGTYSVMPVKPVVEPMPEAPASELNTLDAVRAEARRIERMNDKEKKEYLKTLKAPAVPVNPVIERLESMRKGAAPQSVPKKTSMMIVPVANSC